MFLKYHRIPSLEDREKAPIPPTAITLTHLPQLCLAPPPLPTDGSCATVHGMDIPDCSAERAELTLEDVHFAVKTCSSFHSSRCTYVLHAMLSLTITAFCADESAFL